MKQDNKDAPKEKKGIKPKLGRKESFLEIRKFKPCLEGEKTLNLF